MRTIHALVFAGALVGGSPELAGEACEVGAPRVFKLEPSPELNAMMTNLLGPTDLISSPAGLSVVVVAVPLPCGERLTRVSARVWDGYIVQHRGRGRRMLRGLANQVRGAAVPWLQTLMPRASAQRVLRLSRSARLGKGLSWIGTFNGHGVVMFPVACNSVTGASLTITTEHEVLMPSGRFKRRRRTREVTTVRIPSPLEAADDLQALHHLLGWQAR